MERLAVMCDASADHPWQREGYHFVLSAAMGDLKWMNTHYSIHNYRSNTPCSLCAAMKIAPAIEDTICDFRPTARHLSTRVSHETHVASLPAVDIPAPMRYGIRPASSKPWL